VTRLRPGWVRTVRPRHGVPLAPLTTLGLGGLGATVYELHRKDELTDVVQQVGAAREGTPVVIGYGSNLLVSDDGVRCPIVLMRTRGVRYEKVPDGRTRVTVQAGHDFGALVEETVDEGLLGLESLCGIPGTVGALPVQNVGAYGQEVSDTLVEVRAWDWKERRPVVLDAAECGLGHRTSVFKHNPRWLILEVVLLLRPGAVSSPIAYSQVARALGEPLGARVPVKDLMSAVRAVRATKGMVLESAGCDRRSAGSVFCSPAVDEATVDRLGRQGMPVHLASDGVLRAAASWLMQHSGLVLGQRLARGVRISSRQFTLVTEPGATTGAFVAATRLVQATVLQRTGVRLVPELDPVGKISGYAELLDQNTLEVALS